MPVLTIKLLVGTIAGLMVGHRRVIEAVVTVTLAGVIPLISGGRS